MKFEDENSGLVNSDTIQQDLIYNDNEIEKIDSENNPELKKTSNDVQSSFDKPIAIKLARAYELFNSGVKFIDARPVEEFAEGHIKDAVNIPFYQSEQYEDVLNNISKEEILVTYCSGEDCDLSIMLGDELFEKGYTKVYIFYGGWNDWLDADYPVESIK
ncbi:MAG: rhodanese-like domain-containing protein [Ignavibacteriaceae bacterium]